MMMILETARTEARWVAVMADGKSCTWTLLTSTSNKVEMRGDCIDQGFKTEAKLQIEALSPQEAEGSLQFSTNDENTIPATASPFKAKWIAPRCRTPK